MHTTHHDTKLFLKSVACAVFIGFATEHAVASPFTDEEVERRMAAGAHLSAVCRVEATINKSLSGEHCAKFLHWVRDDFSLIEPNLARATSQAYQHLENYKANLAIIAEIAKSVEAAQPIE